MDILKILIKISRQKWIKSYKNIRETKKQKMIKEVNNIPLEVILFC